MLLALQVILLCTESSTQRPPPTLTPTKCVHTFTTPHSALSPTRRHKPFHLIVKLERPTLTQVGVRIKWLCCSCCGSWCAHCFACLSFSRSSHMLRSRAHIHFAARQRHLVRCFLNFNALRSKFDSACCRFFDLCELSRALRECQQTIHTHTRTQSATNRYFVDAFMPRHTLTTIV